MMRTMAGSPQKSIQGEMNVNKRIITYDFFNCILDYDSNGELILYNEKFGEINLEDVLKKFIGFSVDMKLSKTENITPSMFFSKGEISSGSRMG